MSWMALGAPRSPTGIVEVEERLPLSRLLPFTGHDNWARRSGIAYPDIHQIGNTASVAGSRSSWFG